MAAEQVQISFLLLARILTYYSTIVLFSSVAGS